MYYEGCGKISKDILKAYMWFDLAAKQGNEKALSYCRIITNNLTNPKIARDKGMTIETMCKQ